MNMFKMLLICLYEFISSFHIVDSFNPFNELKHDKTNSTSIQSIFTNYDTSNVPDSLIISSNGNIDQILNVLATRKYRSCKGSVLYNPIKNLFLFRNPSIPKSGSGSGSIKEYIPARCKKFTSRNMTQSQRFYFQFKDIEQLLDNNEDSILLDGIHKLTDLRKGMEITLFPVKFFKSLPESNYTYQKQFFCYDSIKVLGIDKNNNDYYIISALNKHQIIYCDGYSDNKKYNFNNFIRYSSYCDEFCAEDFIYFSNELSKCKCEFLYDVDDLKKNINFSKIDPNDGGCHLTRRLDRYEIFSNSYEIIEKLNKYEEINKPYYRYYFNVFIVICTLQVMYAFCLSSKENIFLRFVILFYITLSLIVYIAYRLMNVSFTFDLISKTSELICDLYPVILLIYIAVQLCNDQALTGNECNYNRQDLVKLGCLIIINSLDQILREIKVNEIELGIRILVLLSGLFFKFKGFIQFFNINLTIRNFFELISRASLYLVDNGLMTDVSVPLFILLGRPNEHFITSDHVLFQANYIKLKPNFENLFENWFLEALNFHKFKDMILFLKFSRYFVLIITYSLIHLESINMGLNKIFDYSLEFKCEKLIFWFIKCSYVNLTSVYYSKGINTRTAISLMHTPITLAYCFTNVMRTKECFKFLLIHFAIGFVCVLVTDDRELRSKRRRITASLRENGVDTTLTRESLSNNMGNHNDS